MSYTVNRVSIAPAMNCRWEDFDAAETTSVDFVHKGSSDHHPKTQVRLLHDDRTIYGMFQVDDQYIRVNNCEYQANVCRDACVEFFFKPATSKGYFNLEMSAGGHHLIYYIWDNSCKATGGFNGYTQLPPEDGMQINIKTTLPSRIDPEITEPTTWRLQFSVPIDMLAKHCGPLDDLNGQNWTCNFYKCAGTNSHPHWMSWFPMDECNFHQPNLFRPLIFK